MGELRATAPEEKEARRRHILTASEELMQTWSFTDITMDRIAERAGVAKGTLYLYFRTKEALFLRLYDQHLEAWYGDLSELAGLGSHTVEPAAAARVIASTLSSRRTLIRLHGLMHSSLARNLDRDTFIDFLRGHHLRMSLLSPALAGRISGLSEDDALRFLRRLEAVAGGLSRAASALPLSDQVLDAPDLAAFQFDFEEELREIATALLK
jgi:AcrR family transcriptional regulator